MIRYSSILTGPMLVFVYSTYHGRLSMTTTIPWRHYAADVVTKICKHCEYMCKCTEDNLLVNDKVLNIYTLKMYLAYNDSDGLVRMLCSLTTSTLRVCILIIPIYIGLHAQDIQFYTGMGIRPRSPMCTLWLEEKSVILKYVLYEYCT